MLVECLETGNKTGKTIYKIAMENFAKIIRDKKSFFSTSKNRMTLFTNCMTLFIKDKITSIMEINQPERIVQFFLKFLAERNIEKISGLFSENVDWYIPGDENKANWLGRRKNMQEVKAFFDLLWRNTLPLSATIDKLLFDGNTAVIIGEFSTKMLRTGKTADSLFCIYITVENNLIVRYRLIEDSYAISDALTISNNKDE